MAEFHPLNEMNGQPVLSHSLKLLDKIVNLSIL